MTRLIIAMLLMGLAQAGVAGSTVEERVPFKKDGSLMVINVSGSVTIKGWRKDEVEVKGELGEDAEELLVEFEDDDLLVKVVQKKDKRGDDYHYRKSGSHLTIQAPYSTSLKVKTVSADVSIEDIRGSQRVRTVSGDLKTSIEGQEAELRTVSGDLNATGNGKSSKVKLYSVSGTIVASDVAGDVWAEAVSGDIELGAVNVEEAHLKTVSGDIEGSFKLERDASLHMESVSGDIEVSLPKNYAAEYELTSFSGDIAEIFGRKAKSKSKYSPGSELMYKHGESKASVRANSLSGDIEIDHSL